MNGKLSLMTLKETNMKRIDWNKCDWMCRCGYRLTSLQYNLYKEDFGCPRCKKSFKVFFPVEPIIKDKDNE